MSKYIYIDVYMNFCMYSVDSPDTESECSSLTWTSSSVGMLCGTVGGWKHGGGEGVRLLNLNGCLSLLCSWTCVSVFPPFSLLTHCLTQRLVFLAYLKHILCLCWLDATYYRFSIWFSQQSFFIFCFTYWQKLTFPSDCCRVLLYRLMLFYGSLPFQNAQEHPILFKKMFCHLCLSYLSIIHYPKQHFFPSIWNNNADPATFPFFWCQRMTSRIKN